jgi:hypothetical protein
MNFDFEILEPDSALSVRLIPELKKSEGSSASKEAIQHKRDIFKTNKYLITN